MIRLLKGSIKSYFNNKIPWITGNYFSSLKYSVKDRANLCIVRNIIIPAVIRQNSIPEFYRFDTPCFLGWITIGLLRAFCTFYSWNGLPAKKSLHRSSLAFLYVVFIVWFSLKITGPLNCVRNLFESAQSSACTWFRKKICSFRESSDKSSFLMEFHFHMANILRNVFFRITKF